ncbi:MAG: hypothetical protein D6739_03145 [Nitrospirae bacterium]|nr:MAG: hypothetical protein D6739_03145 [Nitrospirota bacterium]
MGRRFGVLDRVAADRLAAARAGGEAGLQRELDLSGPLLLSEVCLARAILERMLPGETAIFRSRWEETHRDLIHLCNVLGHEYVSAQYDGHHYFITLRVRARCDRLPRRDAFSLPHPEAERITTLDLTEEAEPLLPGGAGPELPGPEPLLPGGPRRD